MTKIKYFIILLFVIYNTNSQTQQFISVDSLTVIYNQNYKLKKIYLQMNLLLLLINF